MVQQCHFQALGVKDVLCNSCCCLCPESHVTVFTPMIPEAVLAISSNNFLAAQQSICTDIMQLLQKGLDAFCHKAFQTKLDTEAL